MWDILDNGRLFRVLSIIASAGSAYFRKWRLNSEDMLERMTELLC